MMNLEHKKSRNNITGIYTLTEVNIDSLYSTPKKLGVFDTLEGLESALVMHLDLPWTTQFDWGNRTTSGLGYTNHTLREILEKVEL